jgi:hypothetical protein
MVDKNLLRLYVVGHVAFIVQTTSLVASACSVTTSTGDDSDGIKIRQLCRLVWQLEVVPVSKQLFRLGKVQWTIPNLYVAL